MALRALSISEAVQVRPCYGGYAESTAFAGVNLRSVDLPLSLWGARTLHQGKWEKALRQIATDLGDDFRGALFLGNPNNPDGRQLPWKEVEALAQTIPHGFVFLDQSYMDFIELPGQNLGFRAPDFLPHNVLVFQSFTKFFCLAGVRLACVYGGPRPMARLRNRQLPWTVNGPAQEMAGLLYTHEAWLKQAQGYWKTALLAIQHEWSAKGVQPCTRHVPWLFGQLPAQTPGDSFLRDSLSIGSAVRVFQGGPEGLDQYVRVGLPLEVYGH
ncbi:MAG: Threonine-phosphate decarboxylase [Firmicutes bacterium ADurb.Bin456]|nr:MAG: Threonine-phosphate decarboxylase [Firmicutes bacterium ADurb.Bin456]